MIEVDSLRRGYNFGAYDGSYGMPPSQAPYPGTLGPAPLPDNHRVLIHWNQTEAAHRQQCQGDNKTGSRSDVDEDDDDEDRPFTPPPPRERLSYTRYQLELLNGIYIEVRYPNSTQKQLIAKRVGITREQVKIWFQNRRRKDVVGNSGKSNTSTSSSGSQDSDRQLSPAADDSNTSDDSLGSKRDSPEPKDPEDSVVPPLVMKSIINELLKFVNDPLKGRKNKKKSRAKQREKEKAAKLKKGIATTLLAGSYDMISPPNQIVPNAFFDKVKSGFNHSKGSSAFANPREGKPPTQISSVSTTSESPDTNMTSRDVTPINKYSSSHFNTSSPFPFHPHHHGQGPLFPPPTSFASHTGVPGCEIPILSDLLSLRSPIDKRKTPSSTSLPAHVTTSHAPRPTEAGSRSVPDKPFHAMNTFNSGRPLNGIFPYPFLAEQPMFMSSLRQPGEHLFRPSPHYPPAHYSEDPYQPLLISSFSNPYFTSTQASWPGASLQNPPTSVYAPL